jgi:lipoprotein-anchoring transpeptidase ErfK/SrfK
MPEPSEGELFPVSYKHVLKVPKNFGRQEVAYQTNLEAGSIVVNTKSRYLYLNLGGGRLALRHWRRAPRLRVGRRGNNRE